MRKSPLLVPTQTKRAARDALTEGYVAAPCGSNRHTSPDTGLAILGCLDNPDFRKHYVPDDWSTPVTGFSCSMGVDITVISSDEYVLLTQRGQNQSVHQNMFHRSVSEAVSPSFDRSTTGQGPV